MQTADDSVGLSEYWGMVRRRWVTAVVCLLVGLGLAAVYLAVSPKLYTATSTVVVYPITTDNFSQVNLNQAVNVTTEASLVTSTSVAEQAATLLKVDNDKAHLLRQVSAVGAPNTQTITISYTASTPMAAALGANAFATAYLTVRANNANDQVTAVTTSMNTRIVTLEKDLVAVNAAVATAAPSSAVYNDNLVQRQVLTQELIFLRRDLNSLSTLAVVPGALVSEATVPSKPTSPVPLVALAAGVAVGLFLALVCVFWRDRRDDRVRGAQHVEEQVGLPVLAVVGRPVTGPRGPHRGGVTAINGEDYRALAVKLAAAHGNKIGCVGVVGVGDEPPGIVATGLATALSQIGTCTALIAVGSAEPLRTLVPGTSTRTLASASMDATSGSASSTAGAPQRLLDILVAPRESTPLGPGLAQLLEGLRQRYAAVIVMLPGGSAEAETLAWAQLADSFVLAGSVHHTHAQDLTAMIHQVGQVGVTVTGAVLVAAHPSRGGNANGGAPVEPATGATAAGTPNTRSVDDRPVNATE